MVDSLFAIGQFARLAGLSVHTLRHYDAVGILKPSEVDPQTGYRRYSPDLLLVARLIADLRWLAIPLDVIRVIVVDPSSTRARTLLEAHTDRLIRERQHLDQQVSQCTDYASEGVPMPTITAAVVPVQLKIGVTDKARARHFYEDCFDLTEQVIRHTNDADYPGYQFGEYGQPGFFLLFLLDNSDFDHPGRSTFGLSTPDLDATHRRALQAGGTETVPVTAPEGMPRTSAVTDPDGNWFWLYQA